MGKSIRNDALRGPARRRGWAYFARRVVHPWELPSIMRKHTYTGAMGNVWAMLISGMFFAYFGTTIGLSRFQWGLMGGISSWLIAAQVLSAVLAERTGRRKLIWFCSAAADRGLRLAGILLALWLWRAGWSHAGVVLIGAICLANLFGMMAAPPWMSWLADIIPADRHGSFWGRRTAWIALSIIVVIVPAGYVIDRVPGDYKLQATVAVFFAATVIGLLDVLIHGTIPEPVPLTAPKSALLRQALKPLGDQRFRKWLTFNVCWTFSMTLGGGLSTLYFLYELGIKNNFFGGAIVLTCLWTSGSLLTGAWSGRLVDRAGIKPVLLAGHVVWALLPGFWLLARPQTALWWLGAASLVSGVACTAAQTAANKLVTRLPPPELRATYVAVSSSLGSLAGGLGVLTAGTVLRSLGNWHAAVGWLDLSGFRLLFLASLCLRLLSATVLIRRVEA